MRQKKMNYNLRYLRSMSQYWVFESLKIDVAKKNKSEIQKNITKYH